MSSGVRHASYLYGDLVEAFRMHIWHTCILPRRVWFQFIYPGGIEGLLENPNSVRTCWCSLRLHYHAPSSPHSNCFIYVLYINVSRSRIYDASQARVNWRAKYSITPSELSTLHRDLFSSKPYKTLQITFQTSSVFLHCRSDYQSHGQVNGKLGMVSSQHLYLHVFFKAL